jgi:hypothetical protein
MLAQPAQAEIYINGQAPEANSPVKQGEYSGPDMNLAEWAGLAYAVAAAQVLRPEALGGGAAMLGVMTWGAWRTAQYRPNATKQAIHASIALQDERPVAGSVAEVLN